MAIPLFNTLASWILKKRIHQIELFIKYPIDVQNEVLQNLIDTAKHTEVGKNLGFSNITNYSTFKERVPIQQYETIEPLIERTRQGEQNLFWPSEIKKFAKSSGTTNAKSKFIPVSEEAFKGKGLRLGGSSQLYEENNSYFGDLSAIIIEAMPFWANISSAPKQEVALMSEWESKMKAIVDETINENITSLVGVPSWMLVLLNNILKVSGKENILEIWPNLEVYFHGGVNFNPYINQYKKLIPKAGFQYYEVYNASEGFFAIQDKNNSDELLLMLDYGIFYEFIPMSQFNGEDSNAISLEQVKLNVNYAIVITTNAGLWRYLIGDTVKFTSLHPFRIKITGRTKHFINAFGEELIIENAEDALRDACIKTNSEITEYTVAPIYMNGDQKGAHEWVIEFKKSPANLDEFAFLLDEKLKELNSDYEAKRYCSITLKMPVIHLARKGLFYKWLKLKGKLGGQHKVPRLSNKRDFIEELLKL